MKPVRWFVFELSLAFHLLGSLKAAPSFQQVGNTLVMSNANVRLKYDLMAGTTDFYWKNSRKISRFYSGIGFNTGYVKGISYTNWSYALVGTNQVVITATGDSLPAMKQYFTLDQPDSFLVRVEADGSNLKANWMGPVVVDANGGVDLGVTNDNRALCVPFDNDGFVRYNALPINNSSTSYEVGAFYDNVTRNGLVVGSVTHGVWKSGVYFYGAKNGLVQMNVFGGATSPWDVLPHGYVSGNIISSPTVFVGFGDDWRTTMLNYAAENTLFAPRLTWTNGVPFGWNSWGVIQQNINYAAAAAVSDFFHTNLQENGFADDGTVYINLDSYWDNLNSFQLQSFVNHCHANAQKAGIYFGPFVWFGAVANATSTFVEGTANAYHYSDAILRDGNGNFQSVDGGLALDPTHPATKQRISYYINLFTNWGFNFVKLDFLSHGALEGAHYDPGVTTGIQAYNQGMQYVLNAINGTMFISESIAPLFPYQYGHSRRIACDAETSLIGNTEYTMNSVSYGWWLDKLYQFNDPDVMVFGNGADANEQQSRVISGAVTGLFLDGDDLTTTSGQQATQTCLTKAAINAVARAGQTFTPAEGNAGTSAANLFARQDGSNWLVAIFNYTSAGTNETVDLSRAGVPPGSYSAVNLWDGSTATASDSLAVSLNAKQSKLFRLIPCSSSILEWSANANSGVWDTGSSANWINLANSSPTVFNTADQVLFDDTSGVPTTVSVSGTVSPGIVTVNSSANNYLFNGSGSINGTGSLIKQGSSKLTLNTGFGLTGPVTINGGTLIAGNDAFNSVASINITNNSTFDFGGSSLTNNKPITLSGAGFNGQGAIFNSGGAQYGQILNITLAGDATFGQNSGGNSRWDLGNGSQISGPHNLTINWQTTNGSSAIYGEWNNVSVAANVKGITLTNGNFGMNYMGAGFQNPGTVFTVSPNCELSFWNGGWNGSFHVLNGGRVDLWTAPAAFNGSHVTLEDGAMWYGWGSSSSDEPINSAIILNGVAHFVIGDHNLVYTNVVSGPGGFLSDYWNHSIVFSASNSYNGPTIIGSDGNSPEVALSGEGSISHSSLIFFGGSDATVAHVDVSGRLDQTLTLASGQTLAGIGGINGSLMVLPGAVVSPAGTNTTIGITTGTNPVGTIAASSDVTLDGATVIKLNGSGTNDIIQADGNLAYGGILNLVNISRAPLAAGDSFQMFSAANYSGLFASLVPVTPGAGLAWDTNQLSSGVINVVTASSAAPVISSIEVSAGSLIFGGNGGTANGVYQVLTTTNLAAPMTSWIPIATNTYDASGNFKVTNSIDFGTLQQFFLMRMQE